MYYHLEEEDMRHRFAIITAYMTVVALILGNLVVATKAGDACGTDWPTCNGSLIPDLTDYKVLVEYSHRIFTGSLGFVILINAILSWKRKYKRESAVKILSILTMILLLIQSMVGALNVVLGTPPGFTTFDVIVSLLLLTSTVFLTTALKRTIAREQPNEQKRETNIQYRKLFKTSYWVFLLFFLEVIVGAFYKHSGASKIVSGILTNDLLFSSNSLSQFIYYVHGISNTIILLGAFYLVFSAMQKQVLVKGSVMFLFFIVLNGVTGYATQLAQLNEWASSIHMIVVILTVFQGAYLVSKSYFGPYYVNKLAVEGEKNES